MMNRKNTFQATLDSFGQPQADLRTVDMSDWGTPQGDTSTTIQPGEEFVHRGGRQVWAPGEFDEWKQGKLTGMGTTYGQNAQLRFKNRHFPGLQDMINNGAANVQRVMAGNVGTGYMQDLMKRFRR